MNYPQIALGILLGLLAACSTTSDPGGDRNNQRTRDRIAAMKKNDAIINKFPRVLLDLDKAIEKFYRSVNMGSDQRVLKLRTALEKLIREKTRRHFDKLIATADDPEHIGNRGIALAALGFADDPERKRITDDKSSRSYIETALNSLITALNDANDHIVNQAVHGLGMLHAQNTPTKALGDLLENSKVNLGIRRASAWTLMSIQPHLAGDRKQSILPIWIRVLSQPIGELEAEIVVQAVRGLGLYRRAEDARIVEPYCEHPSALVRFQACIALGRQNHQESHRKLFTLLAPTETNRNVRLAARKALVALAGGTDRGYDLKKWEKIFQRK